MKILDITMFLSLAAIWGSSFLFMRVSGSEFGPLALIELRVGIAALCLLPLIVLKGQMHLVWKNWRQLLIVGLFNSALPFCLFAFATLYLPAGYTSIINATAPIWAAMIALIWLNQGLSRQAILGLSIGFLGVIVLVWKKLGGFDHHVTLGVLAGLVATMMYGYAVNYTKVRLQHLNSLVASTGSLIAASLALLPFAIAWWPEQNPSGQSWLAVIALGLICTAVAYLFYFRLIARLGSAQAITVTYLIPLFGTLFGAVFLNEIITLEMILGGILIVTGTALIMGLINIPRLKVRTAEQS